MPDLKKVEDTSGRLRYAYPHLQGWVLAVLGVAGVVLAWRNLDGGALWGALGLGGLFVFGGLSSAFRRLELTFDLDRGRMQYRRGTIFGLESGVEPLDVVERVVLKKDLDRKGGREVVDEWEVELEIRGWPRPVEVFESKQESPARAEAEELARRLGVPLGERTGR